MQTDNGPAESRKSESASPAPSAFRWLVASVLIAVFIASIAVLYSAAQVHLRWEKSNCTIVSSEVLHREVKHGMKEPYKIRLTFSFRKDGRLYESSRHGFSGMAGRGYSELQQLVDGFAPGSSVDCYVSPDYPPDAALQLPDVWPVLLFSLALAAILLIRFKVIRWPAKSAVQRASGAPSITSGAYKNSRPDFTRFAGALFVLTSVIFLYREYFGPWKAGHDSTNWIAADCVVVSSQLLENPDSDDRRTYSLDILYAYQAGEKTYKSNRYRFDNPRYNSLGGKRKMDAFPPGRHFTCYYDPENPAAAVVEPAAEASRTGAAVGILFLIVGLFLFFQRKFEKAAPSER